MPFIDTDDSVWINSEDISQIRRGGLHHYALTDEDRSLQTWELVISMKDGTRYTLRGERAAAAIKALGLPTEVAWKDRLPPPTAATAELEGSDAGLADEFEDSDESHLGPSPEDRST